MWHSFEKNGKAAEIGCDVTAGSVNKRPERQHASGRVNRAAEEKRKQLPPCPDWLPCLRINRGCAPNQQQTAQNGRLNSAAD